MEDDYLPQETFFARSKRVRKIECGKIVYYAPWGKSSPSARMTIICALRHSLFTPVVHILIFSTGSVKCVGCFLPAGLQHALYAPCGENYFFATPWPKVTHSIPAPKRECGFFGPGMVKNSIRTTGIKLVSP